MVAAPRRVGEGDPKLRHVVAQQVLAMARRLPPADESRAEIALRAIREVTRPVTFAVFIMVIVFVPLFTLQSLEGKMFKPLALTICFALLSSLAVSLTVVPVFQRTGISDRCAGTSRRW